MIFEFKTLELNKTTEYGTKISYDIVTEFDNRPKKNHMATFAGLLSSLKYEPPEVRNNEVSKLFRTGTLKKVLVARIK
jgi:hypothetical protein